MSDWPRRWHFINGLTESFSHTERELMELLRKPYHCVRCGRRDLPLALFFEHDANCKFETAILKSSCELQEEIDRLKEEAEDKEIFRKIYRAPTDFRCGQCNGRFDGEHMVDIELCKWCDRNHK